MGPPANDSRAQRTRGAADAIGALRPSYPPRRGIDARALGAGANFSRTGAAPGADGAPRFAARRGGFEGRGRGGPNGFRGRGGARGGRGGRGGGDRGRGERGPRPKRNQAEQVKIEKSTPEYLEYMSALESGVLAPAKVAEVTLETLENYVPSMGASSLQMGEVMALREHFRAITGHAENDPQEGYVHARRYAEGQGTLFVNQADLDKVTGERRYNSTPRGYAPLAKEIRAPMIKQLVGGVYPALGQPLPNDTLGCVELGANRNETYLSTDTQKIVAKVGSMVPIPRKAKPVAAQKA